MAEEKKTKIKLGTPIEFKNITDEGRFTSILIIPYTIDSHHYEVQVNKEGATPEIIEAAVREDAKKVVETKDKTITI